MSIDEIKSAAFDDIRKRKVIMIVESDYGYRVENWIPDGVAPQSDYDTPHEAAARVLQLLQIKEPITPQNWPESVCVGTITLSDEQKP